MNVVLAGAGAIGRKHAAAIARIDGVELVSVVGRLEPDTKEFAAEFDIRHWTLDLGESLDLPGVDAVILATPTGMHAAQSIAAFEMGKHTLIEIPMADNLADSEVIVGAQERTGVVGMVAHTRRFNPSHQWVRARIESGEYAIQHFVVQTFFFRRENTNALGKPRSWTDHLLWHHACHTVDLFQYQTGEIADRVWAQQGPIHPELGIAMDMTIGLGTPSGAICTLALSFNNEGPLGSWFRYIGDNGTYVARYDDLDTGDGEAIDVSEGHISMDGIELQDREFFSAIDEGREPNASVAQALTAMETLDRLEQTLGEQ
ncbi:MAG: Gfo/Idh/MocA family oxidoreductase [Acidimicrobiia bacterium]